MATMELTGTILNAFVEKRKTKNGLKDYAHIDFSDGNSYGSFYNAVAFAAEAHGYVGVNGTTIQLEQNGEFWNYAGVVTEKSATPNPTTNGTPAPTASQVPTTGPSKDETIQRQTAGKVAATLMAGGFTTDQLAEWTEMTTFIENHFAFLTPQAKEWAS